MPKTLVEQWRTERLMFAIPHTPNTTWSYYSGGRQVLDRVVAVLHDATLLDEIAAVCLKLNDELREVGHDADRHNPP